MNARDGIKYCDPQFPTITMIVRPDPAYPLVREIRRFVGGTRADARGLRRAWRSHMNLYRAHQAEQQYADRSQPFRYTVSGVARDFAEATQPIKDPIGEAHMNRARRLLRLAEIRASRKRAENAERARVGEEAYRIVVLSSAGSFARETYLLAGEAARLARTTNLTAEQAAGAVIRDALGRAAA